MKVAVTGAAGFLGANLAELLVESGHDVVAIDRMRSRSPRADQMTWVSANVLDSGEMAAALVDVEVVYHLVAVVTLARNDDIAWRVNSGGARVVAETARDAGVRRMVHCSSLHTYDQHVLDGLLDENSPRATDPALPVYDRSKLAGEKAVLEVVDAGLDAVICNPTAIYGPVDFGPSRFNAMMLTAARGRMPVGIRSEFDLVDVRDVAQGLIAAGERGARGENYLLGGHHKDLFEVFRSAARLRGKRGPLVAAPLAPLRRLAAVAEPIGRLFGSDTFTPVAIETLMSAPKVDCSKAIRDLGYATRPTDETVDDLIRFFVDTKQLASR